MDFGLEAVEVKLAARVAQLEEVIEVNEARFAEVIQVNEARFAEVIQVNEALIAGRYTESDLLAQMRNYVVWKGSSSNSLWPTTLENYNRTKSEGFSGASSVRLTGADVQVSVLLLSQVDTERSQMELTCGQFLNAKDVVCQHFFAGDATCLDTFLLSQAEKLVIFRNFYSALNANVGVVNEPAHFQPYFSFFLDQLIKYFDSENAVCSVNGIIKYSSLFLNEFPDAVGVSGASDILARVSVNHCEKDIADLLEILSLQPDLSPETFAKLAAGDCGNPHPIAPRGSTIGPIDTIFELKAPYSKRGLGGGTLAAQPISQTVLELELEVRNRGATRAVLTDSFILRVIFNTQKDGVSKHYVSNRIFEPVEYIIHLLLSFVPLSDKELPEFLGFEENIDCDVFVVADDVKPSGDDGPSAGTRSKKCVEEVVESVDVGGGGGGGRKRINRKLKGTSDERSIIINNENMYCPNRTNINLNFQDKLDAYNDSLEWLKAVDARRNGSVLLTESELVRSGQQRPIDKWFSDGCLVPAGKW